MYKIILYFCRNFKNINYMKQFLQKCLRRGFLFLKRKTTQFLDFLGCNARFFLLLFSFLIGLQQEEHYCKIALQDPTLENVIAFEAQRVTSIGDDGLDEIVIVPPFVRYIDSKRGFYKQLQMPKNQLKKRCHYLAWRNFRAIRRRFQSNHCP